MAHSVAVRPLLQASHLYTPPPTQQAAPSNIPTGVKSEQSVI